MHHFADPMNRRSFIAQTSAGLALMALPRHSVFGAAAQDATPGFHFGAVYFRGQNNPLREDWERDHRVAAEDGHRYFGIGCRGMWSRSRRGNSSGRTMNGCSISRQKNGINKVVRT